MAQELEEGEKYLYIQMTGHTPMTVFPNRNKKSEREPDYKCNGVAVWEHEKKASPIKGGVRRRPALFVDVEDIAR